MTKKLTALLAIMLALVCVFAVTSFAAENAAYVTSGGSGDKSGKDADNAASTFGNAIKALDGENDAVIYIVGEQKVVGSKAVLAEQSFNITLKGYTPESVLYLSQNLYLKNNSNSNTITFDLPVKVDAGTERFIVGSFNSVTFGENFGKVGEGTFGFIGGVHVNVDETVLQDNASYKFKEDNCFATLPYTITVNAGTFDKFYGGNYRSDIADYLGSITAHVTVNVNGGTFGSAGNYDINTNNKTFDAFSVSGMSLLADKATLNITGGTFNTPVYVQGRLDTIMSQASEKSVKTASDAKYYALDGDVAVNISGGTFNGGEISAYYTQAAYTTLMRGNFDVSITGGTFKEGTVIDATQVVAYEGQTKKATLTVADTVANVTPKRFDVVNGEAKTYDEPIRVVFIGDSITEGYAATAAGVVRLTDGYPAQFLKFAEEADKEVIVGNFGIGSAGFLATRSRDYHDMLAYPMVKEETDPTYVVFALGCNDSNDVGGATGSYESFYNRFKAFAKHFGDMNCVEKVFVNGAIYRHDTTAIANRVVTAVRALQQRTAEELAVGNGKYVFVDMYGLTIDMVKDNFKLFAYGSDADGDLIHPTKAGLSAMGKHCYNAIFNGVYAPEVDYTRTEIHISDNGTQFGEGTAASPISDFAYACAIARPNVEVTFIVDDVFTFPTNIYVTGMPSLVKIVGAKADSASQFVIKGNTFKCGGNTTFDNITLVNNYSGGTFIVGCYNDITITDTVKTTSETQKDWHFCAGYYVYPIVPNSSTPAQYDTDTSASSDKDCMIKIYGGTFVRFVMGNQRSSATAPVGTYSGTMKAIVGGNVSISETQAYVGIVGHNYNQGDITAVILAWPNREVTEYINPGTITSPATYDASNNTGTVRVLYELPEDFEEPAPEVPDVPDVPEEPEITYDEVFGDADGDGVVAMNDVVASIAYFGNEIPEEMVPYYHGKKTLCLMDILTLLFQLVK